MTTQHTHHEHNDVDQSVVEYPSASETTTANSTNTSPEIQGEINTPSSETVHPVAEQVEAHADSQVEQANTATSSEVPIDSSQAITQIQDPSQHLVHSERVDQSATASDTHATPEASTSDSTEAHKDEVFQTEAETTSPIVLNEGQVPHDETDNVAEVETQQLSHTDNDTPVELEAGSPNSPEVEQELIVASVVAQIEFQPSEQDTPSEPVSAVEQEQATIPVDAQDKTQTTTYEEKSEDAEQHTHIDVAKAEEEPAQTEIHPSEVSLPTAEAQTSTDMENTSLPTATAQQLEQQFPYTEIAPLINAKAEEVRPFTEFIEEFRIAEAARLQSALRESQVETFALLNSVEDPSGEAPINLENVEGMEKTEGTFMQAEANQPTNTESKDTAVTEQKTIIDPASRPVSPLLRPATRLRVPRHGLTRHQREEQQANEIAALSLQKTQSEAKEAEIATTATPPSETVTPKPARRYRFDRPASTTVNAKSTSATVSGSTASNVPGLNGNSPIVTPAAIAKGISTQSEETREARTASIARPEQSIQAPQETIPQAKVPTEPTIATPSIATSEQGRRRHTHKEQVTPTPVVETPTSVIETVTPTNEIAPEDLPPLEYSELQKASNSRRRRRHRSSSPSVPGVIATTVSEPATPVLPIPPSPLIASQPASMPQVPPSPMQAPAASYQNALPQNATASSAYNIVSGYTLNQMNQGSEIIGPFMGPEPSPARGSVVSRDGRTTRAESQRSPIIPPASSFTSRSAEHTLHGPSTASMTQFANIVSQAIQTQTDRMVAELRRGNQAPTNVSVSLPPFPSTERVGVFVDVANLLYSARTLRIAVDFGKLLDFLRGNRRLVRAHAYCPTSPQPGDEQMFLQAVKGLGYRITTKNYKTFSSGAKKADLDLDLCMDVVRLVDGGAVDCVVLVSGDSDFMPMLDYCSDHGVRVEVAAFDEAMSATLRQSCDLFVNLSMLEEIRA